MSKLTNEDKLEALQEILPETEKLERLASFYKIMGDPTRLKILIILQQGELLAGDIAKAAGISRSNCSHQLKLLKDAKLVRSRKDGQTIIYSLDDEHINEVLCVAFEHILEENL